MSLRTIIRFNAYEFGQILATLDKSRLTPRLQKKIDKKLEQIYEK